MDCISNRIPDYNEEYSTPEDERDAYLHQLKDEADLANRKATAIQKLLNGWPLSQLSVPSERTLIEWIVKGLFDEAIRTQTRIAELEGDDRSRRDQLRAEARLLHRGWMLHAADQERISRRESEIEAQLVAIDREQEVAR